MAGEKTQPLADPRAEARALDVLVGKNLQKFRVKKNLTQKELGRRLGLTFQQIQKYENATNRVSAPRLFMLSEALDVPLLCFFNENETEKPREEELRNLSKDALKLAVAYDRIGKKTLRAALETLVSEMKS